MTRRATVAALVAVLCTVVATVRAEPASAYYDAITTAQDWETVDSWLRTEPPAETSVNKTSTASRTWWRAKQLSGKLPKAGAGGLATVTLAPTALYVGWEIGHASGLSDWVYGRAAGLGNQTNPTSTATRAYVWKVQWGSGTLVGGGPVWTPEVRTSTNSGSTWSTRLGWFAECRGEQAGSQPGTQCDTVDTVNYPIGPNGGELLPLEEKAFDALQSWRAQPGNIFTAPEIATTTAGSSGCNCEWYTTYAYVLDDAAFTREFIAPTEVRSYNGTTDAGRKTHTTSSAPLEPATDYGSADQIAAEAAIEADDDLATEIGRILHPGGADEPETVALPQPRLNETATQYRQRLRALGFLGTITLSENAGVDVLPEFGPNVVTSITVGTDTYPLLDPWPEPPPTLTVPGPSTTVTIEHNPSTAPAPAPGDPGSAADPPPGNAPPPGGGGTITVGDCTCPAPDFSPITDVDYGDKFPFGVVSLVSGFLGTTLYASPDAPVFDFDFGWLGITPHYVVDLDVMDSYMATVRSLISFCIWIGGLWWFGSRWFGFSGSGDPGSAVDDVL